MFAVKYCDGRAQNNAIRKQEKIEHLWEKDIAVCEGGFTTQSWVYV